MSTNPIWIAGYGPYYGGGVGIVGLLVIILVVYLLLGRG